ncbi:MAG: DNA recombination protein RmuC, partial [Myxococcales bacterium]
RQLQHEREDAVRREAQLAAEHRAAEQRADAALASRDRELDEVRLALAASQRALAESEARREEERRAADDKLALLRAAREQLANEFKALSSEALQRSNQSFLELAKATLDGDQQKARGELEKRQQAIEELVKPVRESLERLDQKVHDVEKARVGAYEALVEQLRSLGEAQNLVRQEANNLVKALRTPDVRGLWGEMQLRRVVELAGMQKHCDFFEQQSASGDGGVLRPDLLVRLPGERTIVVDAKTPLAAYLEAVQAPDDAAKKAQLREHARQVRDKITQLAKKEYWSQFPSTPELVVLFLPAESFLSAAFEHDPALVEYAFQNSVVIATPMTLMSLLKAVAYGWKQQAIAENTKQISALGAELYKRIADMGEHVEKVGGALDGAVKHYNRMVGSLESRVLVSARRLKELGAASGSKD